MGDAAPAPLPDDFRLGAFEISPELRLIRGATRETRVEPKAMAVLAALAGAAPSPVSRDELLQRVWGDQVVREEVLTRCVHQLRNALGDDPRHPDLIETIPRQGYRLRVAPEPLPAAAGDSSTAPASAPPASPRTWRGRTGWLAVAVAVVVGVVVWGVLDRLDETDRPDAAGAVEPLASAVARPPDRSVAVLPYADLSPDQDQEYFADGLADELINLLTRVPGLVVTSRTSAFYFKGKDVRITEVAETLNVRYVIEGSVRKSGDRIRVTAQLIDATRDDHLWSESWDRTMEDVFAVQDEIAARVVDRLRVALPGQPPTVAQTDPEAFNLYLRAEYLARETSPKSMEARALYERSLAIDPGYAPAWNGLGAFCIVRAFAGLLPWDEGWEMARTAARNALAADPDNARAYALLSKVASRYDVDFEAAAEYIEEAYRLAPAEDDVLNVVAGLLDYLGRTEEAIPVGRSLLERDPLNPKYYYNLGIEYYVIEDFETAEELFRHALSLRPDDVLVRQFDAAVSCQRGRYRACLDAYEALAELTGHESWALVGRATALAPLGEPEEAARALATLERDFADETAGTTFSIALIHARQGREDRAIEWLERRFDRLGPAGISTFDHQPGSEALRGNPRYQALLEKAGVSEAQLAAVELDIDLPE